MWSSEFFKPVQPGDPRRFDVTSNAAVKITVYSATGSKLGSSHGTISLSLARGLYSVHLERCGIVRELLVDHDQETMLHDPGPPLHTPAPLATAATSHVYYSEPARRLSVSDTSRPLGVGPHSARLFIFLRRMDRHIGPRHLPSEPVTIHDLVGRKLAMLTPDAAQCDDGLGYAAFSARVAPGTYRLRAAHSRRELAITIPQNRAAHVFIADSGAVRLDDLRVALVDLGRSFNPENDVAAAMESLLAALKSPTPAFPPDARSLLPEAIDQDLCFGIVSAHQLWRCEDYATFGQVVQRLMLYVKIPDVAILAQQRAPSAATVRRGPIESHGAASRRALDIESPAQRTHRPFEVPPLLRASLVMAIGHPELSLVGPDSAVARAAAAGLHDSIWCTWGTRAWDDRWIEPTVESLRDRGDIQSASIARMIGLPPRTVDRALSEIDRKLPLVDGSPARAEDLQIPGYTLGEVLGRGSQGTVFRAIRTADGEAVALKIIPLVGGHDRSERVEHDLHRLRRLSHPGILVSNHWGFMPNDTGIWFDMELCRESVFDRLSASDVGLPFGQARRIVFEALDVLEYLHSEGIVHGNIRPSNLLIRTNGSVVIVDPGLTTGLLLDGQAVVIRRAADVMRFTPRERIVDSEHSVPASDVWSMAATLYFLLVLDFPRDEYAGQTQLEAALENPVVPIAERWAEVPDELARCIDRALSDDIKLRPKDGAQFREDMMLALGPYSSWPVGNLRLDGMHVHSADHTQLPKGPVEAPNVPSSASAELSSDSWPSIHRQGSRQMRAQGGDTNFSGPPRPASVEKGDGSSVFKARTFAMERAAEPLPTSSMGLIDRKDVIAHLRVLTGQSPNALHVFQANGASIGRIGGGCDFLIDDSSLSRRHARIERGATGWQVQDLMSRSGGFVDGRAFGAGERMPLTDGSVIRLGDTLMVFRTSAPISDGRADSPVLPGISPVAVALRRLIHAIGSGSGHVLILGETGTGKDRIAKEIGERRAPHPFVTMDCTKTARTDLFGHVFGTYSLAPADQIGLIVKAEDGVLFLDHIDKLSLDVQAELLHFLKDGSYRPLGSGELRYCNARVVAAAHVDLDQAVHNSKLRRDLLACLRASNVPLELPPLRERREDILGWTQLFLRQKYHVVEPNPWTVGALECLLLYPWTENLRELRRAVILAVAQSPSFPLGIESLPGEIRTHREMSRARPIDFPSASPLILEIEYLPAEIRMYREMLRTRLIATPDEPIPSGGSARSEPTKAQIEEVLLTTQGRVREASQQLGIDRRQLSQLAERFGIMLEAHGIDLPPETTSRHVILFLAANPDRTTRLALEEECAAIEREVRMTTSRDDFDFRSKWAVSFDEMMRHLNKLKPTVVHFSGHGDGSGGRSGVYLQDNQRGLQHVRAHALAQMIGSAAPSARVVVLNACFSDAVADTLRSVVDCVVGTRDTIGDDVARSFAVGFYRALGYRRSVGNAVAQAVAALAAKQSAHEHLPVCRTRDGINADQVVLPSLDPPRQPGRHDA